MIASSIKCSLGTYYISGQGKGSNKSKIFPQVSDLTTPWLFISSQHRLVNYMQSATDYWMKLKAKPLTYLVSIENSQQNLDNILLNNAAMYNEPYTKCEFQN